MSVGAGDCDALALAVKDIEVTGVGEGVSDDNRGEKDAL